MNNAEVKSTPVKSKVNLGRCQIQTSAFATGALGRYRGAPRAGSDARRRLHRRTNQLESDAGPDRRRIGPHQNENHTQQISAPEIVACAFLILTLKRN